jgi:soluble lytic murein transglycosylase-like protein
MVVDRADIDRVASAYGLDSNLLLAQVMTESSGDPNAFRYENLYFMRYIRDNPAAKAAKFGPLAACSFGLMQILLETACEIGFIGQPWELFQPAIGLEWGAKYLRSLIEWSGGNVDAALAAYNGGKLGNQTPPYKNAWYVARVKAQLGHLT